jgi:PAS domain S-box-containing protein
MKVQSRSRRRATSALLPVATAALATGIFIVEAITPLKLTAAIFYVLVVLLAARFCSARGIVLVGAGCVSLTVIANVLSAFGETEAGGIKTAIGAAVVGVTAFLAVRSQSTEARLRESEKQWREVFEHNPVMYFMVSPTGTVLSLNSFGAAQLGYTAAELIGQSVLTVFFEGDHDGVRGQLATCVKELGRSHSWEIRKIRKDGSVLWVRENAKAVRRPGNDVIVLIACEDITERRRGEQGVAAAYAATRILAEADSLAAAAPHLLGAIGDNLEWDWGALWSFEREGVPLRCDCLWHARDIETAEFDTVSRERKFPAGESRLSQVWRSGLPIWMVDATTDPEFLRASAASRAGLHGGVIFPVLLDTEALGVVEFFSRAARERDEEQLATLSAIGSQIGQFIKRRRAEAALRASEERWRTLFETSAAGMALEGLDGVFTAANPALQRMIGRTEEEIVGHNVLELNHEDERAATADALAKFRSGSLTERHVEKKYQKKDGSLVWLNITTTLVPATETAAPFLQAVYVDATRRVQSEAALRASDERWRAIFESAAVGIATGALDGGVLSMNPTFQRMLGYTEDEFRNLTVFEFTHEDDRAETRRFFSGIVTGQQTGYRLEKRYRRKNGATIWADVGASMVPATDTTPAFLAVMAVDITDRKRTEDALRRSEAYLSEVFLTMPDGVAIIGRDYRYERVNPVYERRTGLTCEQIVGMHVADINGVEAFNETIKPELDRCFAGEHVSYGRWSTGFAPGQRYHAITYAPLFVSESKQPGAVLAITRDLTEYMQASEALQQAQADLARLNRVMVLGEMTASIAHEINQPIAAVITNANAGLRWLGARPPDLDETRQTLGRIVRDGTRAGEVIGRIRALVKKVPPRRDLLDINQAIREVVALTQTEMQRNDVRLQSRLADRLPLVSADRIQLQQVLINLIINAIEAMAGTSDWSRELAILSDTDDANDVFVEVQDTGPGLDPENLDRLFESFYTTKPDGIGMGLAISRSIAEAHGGQLSAAPNNPCGAVFRLTLPVEETLGGDGAKRSRPLAGTGASRAAL